AICRRLVVRAQPRGAAAAALRERLSLRPRPVHLGCGDELGGAGVDCGGAAAILAAAHRAEERGAREKVFTRCARSSSVDVPPRVPARYSTRTSRSVNGLANAPL